MKIYITPNRTTDDEITLDLDTVITDFGDRVRGWQLEVADRVMNGWSNEDGTPAINYYDAQKKRTYNHVPDAGFATLQIVLSYFEVIGLYRSGNQAPHRKTKKGQIRWDNRRLFLTGFSMIFPDLPQTIGTSIWEQVRCGLYHTGMDAAKIMFAKSPGGVPFQYLRDENGKIYLFVDPHALVNTLVEDFDSYIEKLHDESQIELRLKFVEALKLKYDVTDEVSDE